MNPNQTPQPIHREQCPFLPDCQPVILVLAFWPRICDCTGSRPAT